MMNSNLHDTSITAPKKDESGDLSRGKEQESGSLLSQLAGGGKKQHDPFVSSSSKKGNLLILLVVMLTAAGVLFGMRKLGMRTGLKIVDIKIDYPLDGSKNAGDDRDHRQVLEVLHGSNEVVQVPLKDVQMNPFEWRVASRSSGPVLADDAAREAERIRKLQEEERKKRQTAFNSLKLASIMGGSVPVARVSGELVKINDTIAEYFKVTGIDGRSVALIDDMGKSYTLTIGE